MKGDTYFHVLFIYTYLLYSICTWLRLLTLNLTLVRTWSYSTPSHTTPALCTLPPPHSRIDGGGSAYNDMGEFRIVRMS